MQWSAMVSISLSSVTILKVLRYPKFTMTCPNGPRGWPTGGATRPGAAGRGMTDSRARIQDLSDPLAASVRTMSHCVSDYWDKFLRAPYFLLIRRRRVEIFLCKNLHFFMCKFFMSGIDITWEINDCNSRMQTSKEVAPKMVVLPGFMLWNIIAKLFYISTQGSSESLSKRKEHTAPLKTHSDTHVGIH